MSGLDDLVVDQGGTVTVTRERKPRPLPSIGVHDAECVEATVQESKSEKYPGRMEVTLKWKLADTYVDEDYEETKNYLMWANYGLAYGPKARLNKVCVQLTGREPAFTRTQEKRGTKTYDVDQFMYKQFVGMKAQIVVEHNPAKDGSRTFANVATYLCTPEQQKANCGLIPNGVPLPPEAAPETVMAKMTAQEEAPKEEVVDLASAAKEVMASIPSPDEGIIKKVNGAVTKHELEALGMILVDDNSSPAVKAAYEAKLLTFA